MENSGAVAQLQASHLASLLSVSVLFLLLVGEFYTSVFTLLCTQEYTLYPLLLLYCNMQYIAECIFQEALKK